MPTLKFITEIIPKKNQIIVTSPNSPVGAELINQLRTHSSLEIIPASSLETLPSVENLSVIVHILIPQTEHLSHVLFTTVHLYHLLLMAGKNNAQFILLLPHSSDPLFKTSFSLVTQYAKNNHLRYQVIEYNPHSSPIPISEEVIRKFIHNHQNKLKAVTPSFPVSKKASLSRNKQLLPKIIITTVLLGFVFILYPLLNILASRYLIDCTFNNLANRQIIQARSCSRLASKSLSVLDIYSQVVPPYKYISQLFSMPISESKQISTDVNNNLTLLLNLVDSFSGSLAELSSSTNSSSQSSLLPIMLTTNSESFAQLNDELITYFQLSSILTSKSSKVMDTIKVIRRQLIQLSQISEENYQTLFKSGTYNLLLVINDEYIPKPNGGVPDTLVLITVHQGLISQTQIIAVKDADTRLIGQVSPPLDFQNITGKTTWKLIDTNWDPNFPTTADRYAWFVNKELSFNPDLIISANSSSLAKLLDLAIKYRVGDSKQLLTSQAFRQQMLDSGTTSNTPIYTAIKSLSTISITQNRQLLSDFLFLILFSLDDRQIYIYPTSKVFNNLKSLNMTGEIRLDSCLTETNCVNDYFYVTNTLIDSRLVSSSPILQTRLEKQFTPTVLNSTYEIQYTYPDYPQTKPQKATSYVRIYLPQNSNVNMLQVNNSYLTTDKYTVSPYGNLLVLSFLTDSELSTPLKITLTTGSQLPTNTNLFYQLQVNTQPGLKNNSNSLQISYPANWSSSAYQTPSLARSGLLRYNTLTNSDYPFRLNLLVNNE